VNSDAGYSLASGLTEYLAGARAMGLTKDREYFAKREAQERDAAVRAAGAAKRAHSELADRYAGLLSAELSGKKSLAD